MLSQCMIKHKREICNVNEELTKLQELVKVLKEKVNNLEQVIEYNTKSEHRTEMLEATLEPEAMLKCKQCNMNARKKCQ